MPQSKRLRPRSIDLYAAGGGPSGAAAAGEVAAREAQQHHGPGQRLGNRAASEGESDIEGRRRVAPNDVRAIRSQSRSSPSSRVSSAGHQQKARRRQRRNRGERIAELEREELSSFLERTLTPPPLQAAETSPHNDF